ncbi:MAG: glycosyltransferase [Actinomycetota bacterium]|nr:glycosyltransferase [Actinomycetota bacterium]
MKTSAPARGPDAVEEATSDTVGVASAEPAARPEVRGKFLYSGGEKMYVRGATYGAFEPDEHGNEYHVRDLIRRDFAQMAAAGFNAVRIPHTMPPRALLDIASEEGLKVMVGLSAEQYVGYLIDSKGAPDVVSLTREKVAAVAGHPAILCYALGNEIPAPTARWIGRRKIEDYLERLCDAARAEDPGALVTYVNYPSTEYLQLPFLDLCSFNVYLEDRDRFTAYLARLHNICGDRPLLMSEIGLDSLRNGEDEQATSVRWQLRTTFEAGCAGAFVFSWTDEWYRAGAAVEDWAFGLTDRARNPKPALAAAADVCRELPFEREIDWPFVSVVVCCYNSAPHLEECLHALLKVDYPRFEVIVVDDGSTDDTADIARRYDFRLIATENRGLSSARNTGAKAAMGDIVAFLDSDAAPDEHWLQYLASTYLNTDFAAVGGPNIPPPGDGRIAECVANAPGGPIHVLLSDTEAEHIPGCNLSVRKTAFDKIGGFDPRFGVAGDDVDFCWRLQEEGWKIGFNPAAVVWHHRRNSVRAYWRQQKGYGKAEALLEGKWPQKYNPVGHVHWIGRIYGATPVPLAQRSRIYHGIWGTAPFQFLYQESPSTLHHLPLTPEWWLITAALACLSLLGLAWSPLLGAVPLLSIAVAVVVAQAIEGGTKDCVTDGRRGHKAALMRRGLTTFLHLIHPIARLRGRLGYGLAPWRRLRARDYAWPRRRETATWTESWIDPVERLRAIEAHLRARGCIVFRGGDFDVWDLEVRGGPMGGGRILMSVEDHGGGAQLVRIRSWPKLGRLVPITIVSLMAAAAAAFVDGGWPAGVVLGSLAAAMVFRSVIETGTALGVTSTAARRLD